jgi:hypothetical protein
MNRRSFLRSVLLSAAAWALPWKGKAVEPEPVVSAELADSVSGVFDVLDDLDKIDVRVAPTVAADWLSQIQPQGTFEERAREYIEQMHQVAEEYIRVWGDFAEA